MKDIIIRVRTRFFLYTAIILLAATAFFAWLYVNRVKNQNEAVDFIRSVYFGLAVGGTLGFIRALMSVFSKKPAMAITEKGIIDFINLDGAQIPWENVLGAEVLKTGIEPSMVVYVNNTDELIGGLKKFRQRVATAKAKKTGSPIILGSRSYDYKVQEIIDLINSRAAAQTGE